MVHYDSKDGIGWFIDAPNFEGQPYKHWTSQQLWCPGAGGEVLWSIDEQRVTFDNSGFVTSTSPLLVACYNIAAQSQSFAKRQSDLSPATPVFYNKPGFVTARGNFIIQSGFGNPFTGFGGWSFVAGVGATKLTLVAVSPTLPETTGEPGRSLWLHGSRFFQEFGGQLTPPGARIAYLHSDGTWEDVGTLSYDYKFSQVTTYNNDSTFTPRTIRERWPTTQIVAPRGDGICFGEHWKVDHNTTRFSRNEEFNTTTYRRRTTITDSVVLGETGFTTPAYLVSNTGLSDILIPDPAVTISESKIAWTRSQVTDLYYNNWTAQFATPAEPNVKVLNGDSSPGGTNYGCTIQWTEFIPPPFILLDPDLYGPNARYTPSMETKQHLALVINGSVILDYPVAAESAFLNDYWYEPHAIRSTSYVAVVRKCYVDGTWFNPDGTVKPIEQWEYEVPGKPWAISVYEGGSEVWRSRPFVGPPHCKHSSNRWLYFRCDSVAPEEMTATNNTSQWTAGPLMKGQALGGKWGAWKLGIAEDNLWELVPMGQLTQIPNEIEPWFGLVEPDGVEFKGKWTGIDLVTSSCDYPFWGLFGTFDVVQNANTIQGELGNE
jgi:hypothetical protein